MINVLTEFKNRFHELKSGLLKYQSSSIMVFLYQEICHCPSAFLFEYIQMSFSERPSLLVNLTKW